MIFFMHGGSRNHGCEAIVRSSAQILNSYPEVYSFRMEDDLLYHLDQVADMIPLRFYNRYSLRHIIAYLLRKGFKTQVWDTKQVFRDLMRRKEELCLSVGGDNYCYEPSLQPLRVVNKALVKNDCPIVLWGCSIEPEIIEKNPQVVEDLHRYSAIFARESITYEALKKLDLNHLYLHPDPAFTLATEEVVLPDGFFEDNTIGVNMSPLIQSCENKKNLTFENYYALIEYIINHTNCNIALIPHVTLSFQNDLTPMNRLYQAFQHTGRVVLIGDCNCMRLKGYISKCRMFIGARTHATIAAYSSCVPTLVVGYSVKSLGIAKDVFGTDQHYVLPVQKLETREDLLRSYLWMEKHEAEIRIHLQKTMPGYIKKAWEAGAVLQSLGFEKKGE